MLKKFSTRFAVMGQVPFNLSLKEKDSTFVKPFLFWSEWRDLNPRPLRPERSTLPNCATPRKNPIELNLINIPYVLYYLNKIKSRKFLQYLTLGFWGDILCIYLAKSE